MSKLCNPVIKKIWRCGSLFWLNSQQRILDNFFSLFLQFPLYLVAILNGLSGKNVLSPVVEEFRVVTERVPAPLHLMVD